MDSGRNCDLAAPGNQTRGSISERINEFTAINDGSLGKNDGLNPEQTQTGGSLLCTLDGKRAGMIFFDMAEPSQIIEAVEPLFLNLNTTTELVPVMNADDLRKGLAKVAGK
jgi:hypothetical protein